MNIQAVLFDLDGTLVDTAGDMAAALNAILLQEKIPALPVEYIRPYVSQGGLALIQLGFSEHVDEAEIEPLRQRFLKHYRQNLAVHSIMFDGFTSVLQTLEQLGIAWGIVTNKPGWLTDPLLQQMGLYHRAAVIISGDTTAERKPHPLPLTTAAEQIGANCEHCIYIGDDPRDIQSGKAARMKTLVAAYGYIFGDTDLNRWNADGIINYPKDLLTHPLFN